ncbi:MAG: hypothetical protein ACRC5F_08140, partial [Cetobacterium sp.]
IINYWYDDVICIKGDYIDMETGEFLLSKEFVFSVANDSNFKTKLKVLDGELKDVKTEENKMWILALQTAIKIKEKKEKCVVRIKQNSDFGEKFRVVKVVISHCGTKEKKKECEQNEKLGKNLEFSRDIKGAICYNEKNNKDECFRLPFT